MHVRAAYGTQRLTASSSSPTTYQCLTFHRQKNEANEPNDRLAAIERVLEMLVQRDKARSDQELRSYQVQPSQDSSVSRGEVLQQRLGQQPTPQSQLDSGNVVGELEMRESSEEESIDGLATVSNINHQGSIFFGPSSRSRRDSFLTAPQVQALTLHC